MRHSGWCTELRIFLRPPDLRDRCKTPPQQRKRTTVSLVYCSHGDWDEKPNKHRGALRRPNNVLQRVSVHCSFGNRRMFMSSMLNPCGVSRRRSRTFTRKLVSPLRSPLDSYSAASMSTAPSLVTFSL